ncbi:MAG: hypothetical protein V2A71_06265 [Candidatus Eisenbacteria bacterium]
MRKQSDDYRKGYALGLEAAVRIAEERARNWTHSNDCVRVPPIIDEDVEIARLCRAKAKEARGR